jgi:hypothetical protein
MQPTMDSTISSRGKTDMSKMDTCSQLQDPHIWIPRTIKKESSNHPNSQAQGKTRQSLMQPQQ